MKSSVPSQWPRSPVTILFFLILASLIGGCSSAPEAPYPSDQSLIDTFMANQAVFARLLSDPQDKALHSQLGIRRVLSSGVNPTLFTFEVWFHDFPGPGGVTKGFAYLEKAPPENLIVESIDKNTNPPISPEQKTLYRRIQGNWYLYFHSIH